MESSVAPVNPGIHAVRATEAMQSLSQAELRKPGVMMENFTARFVAERTEDLNSKVQTLMKTET